MLRREALKIAGGVLAAGFAVRMAEAGDPLPKGPKIAPPPAEEGKPDLTQSQMVGMALRIVKPGQAVTQDYNEGRLTITVDHNNLITDIRVG